MIAVQGNTPADQARRLQLKTQEQRLKTLAVEGTGISPWEADVLQSVVQEVFFSEPANQPLKSGQMYYECVAAGEGAGKPIEKCRLVRVVLTLLASEDRQEGLQADAAALRRHRLLRLSEEAREQGGLLSQEDLAQLLMCDVRTIRRDVQQYRSLKIVVATRGQQEDIGPGVTHRGMAIRHWLEGAEPVEVARRIHHSLHAVERYIQHFSRVVFLTRKQFPPLQVALTVGISTAAVNTYVAIYREHEPRPELGRRWEEIDLIGAANFEAKDAEKGGPSHSAKSNCARSRP
jgi:hypothetical protein